MKHFVPSCGEMILPPGDRDRGCLVCHRYIPEGDALVCRYLAAKAHNVGCAALIAGLDKAYDRSLQGRRRTAREVRHMADGATCDTCAESRTRQQASTS